MNDIQRAAALLRAGELVGFPTETVYGLGGLATDAAAVRKIFTVKGRPPGHPVIVHLASADQLGDWASSVPAAARELAAAAWPGPLTLLLPRGARVIDEITGGRSTVGLRVPAHPMATALLSAVGDGVAAPSANRFGRVSPTTAQHVRDEFGAEVAMVLDGGPCDVGVESTIVDCTVDPPMLLRHGAITVEFITEVLGHAPQAIAGPSRASGMLDSHYAPACRVVLASNRAEAEIVAKSLVTGRQQSVRVLNPHGGLDLFARGIYRWLREADADNVDVLVVVRPPTGGLGAAIDERLRKASAPRPPPGPRRPGHEGPDDPET